MGFVPFMAALLVGANPAMPTIVGTMARVGLGSAIATLGSVLPASSVLTMWARDTAYPPITMCAKRGPLGPTPTTVYLTTVGLGMGIATLGSVTKGSVSMM